MKSIFPAGVALLTAVSGSAMAADIPRSAPAPVYSKPPMAAPVYNWRGCYFGGHAGGDWWRDHYVLNNGAGTVEAFDFNPSSWIGGVQFGCEYQFDNNFVAGIEGTWLGTDISQSDPSVLLPGHTRTLKINALTTVTGRLGYGREGMQIYAKGGFAAARVNIHTENPTVVPSVIGDDTSWHPAGPSAAAWN